MGVIQFEILKRVYLQEPPSLVTNADPYLETTHHHDESEESHAVNVEPSSGTVNRNKAKAHMTYWRWRVCCSRCPSEKVCRELRRWSQ